MVGVGAILNPGQFYLESLNLQRPSRPHQKVPGGREIPLQGPRAGQLGTLQSVCERPGRQLGVQASALAIIRTHSPKKPEI